MSPSSEDSDRVEVKISDDDRKKLNQLKNKEEIGEDCLLGGCSVYDTIKQGYFEKHGKFCQSFERVNLSKKEENPQGSNNDWRDKVQYSRENRVEVQR